MIAVDTDVLLAAMARDGTVRRLLVAADARFVTVAGALEALRDHRGLLAARTRASGREIDRVVEILSRYVEEVPFETYADAYTGLEMAYPWAGVREVDLLALAKATDAAVWTHDEAFDQADDLRILDTDDVFQEVAR